MSPAFHALGRYIPNQNHSNQKHASFRSQLQTAQTLPIQVKETSETQEAGDECTSDGSIDDSTEWSDRDQLEKSPAMERLSQ